MRQLPMRKICLCPTRRYAKTFNRMKTRWFILGLAVIAPCSARAADDLTLTVREERGEIEIRLRKKPVLVYTFATNQFKPYVRDLFTLRGENVLRDAPPDHLHHHGMMYAVYVNGINFWEEKGTPGLQRHIKLQQVGNSDAKGLPAAHFTELIHWLAPTNLDTPLLIERRKITVAVNEDNQEVAVRWDAQFQAGPKAGTVRLHGPNYNGLGLRLPESFNHVARFQNSLEI